MMASDSFRFSLRFWTDPAPEYHASLPQYEFPSSSFTVWYLQLEKTRIF